MKTTLTIKRSDINVRKWLPTSLVGTRVHRNPKNYRRSDNKAACRDE